MAMTLFPDIISWPSLLNRDRMWKWELAGTTVGGGRTLTGAMPLARIDGGGLWMCEMGDVQVSSANQVRAWRALAARLDGGATPVVMECRDTRFAPWPLVGGVQLTSNETTNDDNSPLDDDTPYEGDVIEATLVNAVALRATTATIRFSAGGPLVGGEYFSIQHDTFSHRIYRVASVVVSGTDNTVKFRPPLREAVTAGTRVEFDTPKCVMKLATPDAMDLALELRFHGKANVRLVEEFPPFNL